jgi:hypothetical protein
MLGRKLFAIITAVLITLSSSSVFAAFGDMELIRIYYDRNGSEIATDLGNINSILANPNSSTFAGTFGALNLSTSYVVYFALNRSTNELWASGSTETPSMINGGSSILTLKSGATMVYGNYNNIAQGGSTATGLASAIGSYKNKLSSIQGGLGNTISASTRMSTEASLADILNTPVTQTLYYWTNGLTTISSEKTGIAVATITTYADASSTLIPTSVTPIPPAFLLMGSGLVGLVGLRRKKIEFRS